MNCVMQPKRSAYLSSNRETQNPFKFYTSGLLTSSTEAKRLPLPSIHFHRPGMLCSRCERLEEIELYKVEAPAAHEQTTPKVSAARWQTSTICCSLAMARTQIQQPMWAWSGTYPDGNYKVDDVSGREELVKNRVGQSVYNEAAKPEDGPKGSDEEEPPPSLKTANKSLRRMPESELKKLNGETHM